MRHIQSNPTFCWPVIYGCLLGIVLVLLAVVFAGTPARLVHAAMDRVGAPVNPAVAQSSKIECAL